MLHNDGHIVVLIARTAAEHERETQRAINQQKRYSTTRTAAAQQIKLMASAASKKLLHESADNGLVILVARYGYDLHIDYGST